MEEQIYNSALRMWSQRNTTFDIVMFFSEIRGTDYCLYEKGFGPLLKAMKYEDEIC